MATLAPLPALPPTMRVVQPGTGSQRPLLLAYHVPTTDDDALRRALGPSVFIATDNRAAWTDYGGVDPLSKIVPLLEQRYGTKLGPILVAGFSAGGNGTRTILAQGGDPHAVITADATYGSTPESMSDWATFAQRALTGSRVFIASHTSYLGQSATWRVLQAITGWKLPLGAGTPSAPAGTQTIVGDHERRQKGNLVVYSYPTWDMPGHMVQASSVLPAMAAEALRMVGGGSTSTPWGLMFAGLLAGVFVLRKKRV